MVELDGDHRAGGRGDVPTHVDGGSPDDPDISAEVVLDAWGEGEPISALDLIDVLE
jgi:hypothetical protein